MVYTRCHYIKTIEVCKWYLLYRLLTLNYCITGSLDFAVGVHSLFTASIEFNISFVNAGLSMIGDVSQCTLALFNTTTHQEYSYIHGTTEIAWEPFINESCQLMLSREILCHINALHE